MLLVLIGFGCQVKKVGGYTVDEKCNRSLKEVWDGERCSAAVDSEVPSTVAAIGGKARTVCTDGVNDTVCEVPLVENSYWASDERSYKAPTGDKIAYNAFYKFNVDTQTWEHYLFQKIPFLDFTLYERRAGTFEIHRGLTDEYLVMNLDESSCAGQQSLFEIFDTPKRDIYVGRNDNVVALSMSAELTSAFGIKIEEYKEHLFASIYTYIYDIVFAPLTPEFWQSVVTGSYSYTPTAQADFEASIAGGRQSCFSAEGYAEIKDAMNIPPLVKAALDAAR